MNYPIEQVLKNHTQASKNVRNLRPVAHSLGDAYLLNHNLVYRNLRRKILSLGYRTSEKTLKQCSSFSLIGLPFIKKNRLLPYRDNVSALKYAVGQNPKLTLDIHFPLFDSNTLLHESAHVCADAIIRNHKNVKKTSLKGTRHLVLHQLLEEAFANACEIAAWQVAKNRYEKFFLSCNSYAAGHRLKAQKQRNQKETAFYFNLLVLSYLCSNFLYQSIDRQLKKRVIELAQKSNPYGLLALGPNMKAQIELNLKYGLQLSPQFRLVTSDFYFKLIGLNKSITQLTNVDFMKLLESDSSYSLILKDLCYLVWNTNEK